MSLFTAQPQPSLSIQRHTEGQTDRHFVFMVYFLVVQVSLALPTSLACRPYIDAMMSQIIKSLFLALRKFCKY